MPVLRRKTEREGSKRNIGGYFPTHIDTYLTLCSLARGVTKTSIIQHILEEWIVISRLKESEKVLTCKIIQRLKAQWVAGKTLDPNLTFPCYLDEVRTELLTRGLSEEKVTKILKAIEDGCSKS